jgi:threonine dehydrogenase-like Zn-dependent dehydrogenase
MSHAKATVRNRDLQLVTKPQTMRALVFDGPGKGGKERMRRLIELVRHKRLDLTPLLTHSFPLDQIREAYDFFGGHKDGVLKIAIRP